MPRCVCGFSGSGPELKDHRKGCDSWKTHGQCRTCKRSHYRHKKGCPELDGDDHRRRLLEKHGIDQVKFEQFLRVLSKRYRKLARVTIH